MFCKCFILHVCNHGFYRAMHYIATLSLSVTLMYRGHISWVSFKVITRLISVGSSLLRAPTPADYTKGNTPKLGWNRGDVAVLSSKPAISLKRDKIGPMLIGSCICSFDWYQNQWPRMTLNGHYTLHCTKHAYFGAYNENLNENRPTLSAAKM